jgi:alpha-N-arabinofuranosidase
MRTPYDVRRLLLPALLAIPVVAAAAEPPLRRITFTDDPATATVRVHSEQSTRHRIPRYLTGKFAEHLWWNIYNGMDAQILRNPTFGDYPFRAGPMSPDGIALFHWEEDRIAEGLRRQATRYGCPEDRLDDLVAGRRDGLACFWMRVGSRDDVIVSPDTGPFGGRTQRVQTRGVKQGIAQWAWLPLHRVRQFEFELYARSPDLTRLSLSLAYREPGAVSESDRRLTQSASSSVEGLGHEWRRFAGVLAVPADAPADVAYRFALTTDGPGQLVIRHLFLRPADHIEGFDPDVVRLLRESRLPILRWPGGNFVSGYHWEDGIGPIERRRTRPNYAWGGVEPNTFGTDEFMAFCRAVGAEPMICVNAGSGTPEEAARWIEYCNGAPNTPMGSLRAANGHPEAYGVKHWEVGNELWGKWQYYWTTAEGYVDRLRQFAGKMREADPSIELHACGAPVFWGKDWNDTLIQKASSLFRFTTDHPLIGGTVAASAEPLDVYRDFMAVPEVLEAKWTALREEMLRAGIPDPRLAVTELQLFPHLGSAKEGAEPARLTQETLVDQDSITEAIYDVLIYHACVRLAPFVEMVTHSATVNHGGGLRKQRERVWANPCYYARKAWADFGGAEPLPVELETAALAAPRVLPDLRRATDATSFGAIDASAARHEDGRLLLSLVHRGAAAPIEVNVELVGSRAGGPVEVMTLSADKPWLGNTLEEPEAVTPRVQQAEFSDGLLTLRLQPFTFARLDLVPERK